MVANWYDVDKKSQIRRLVVAVAAVATLAFVFPCKPAFAEDSPKAEPIKVGFGIPTSGVAAQDGKQILIALQLWRDDVNAKGGLLGRPIELVYYDDQGLAGKEPGIYRKLLGVDKVDLVIGPYGINAAAAAMRAILDYDGVTISILGAGANSIFSNSKYFSMAPSGPDGPKGSSKSFFDFANQLQPKPRTVAILAADTDSARTIADGARANAVALGFEIAFDKSYQAENSDFGPILREVQATNVDALFVSASSSDTVGIVKAANDIGLAPKMFGGSLPGLQVTTVKTRLGPLLNGLFVIENFAPAFNFPGLADLLRRYRSAAASAQTDLLGYELVPFGYAAAQVLAQAVEQTNSLHSDELAEYIHNNHFETVVGDIEFGKNGEWKNGRTILTQFQHVNADDVEQFAEAKVQPIVWPLRYRTGDILYPYADARK